MGFLELFLIAVGLSMDAFAVAICQGLSMGNRNLGRCALVALFFGGFQALMPLVGYTLGVQFQAYITSVDHWLAFLLLSFIGLKMIHEARKPREEKKCTNLSLKSLILLSIATSIDALAVGITFAFLQVNILPAAALIGVTTFLFSLLGTGIGNVFGARYQAKAELTGGVILIGMGLRILLSHLGILV